MKKIYQFLAMGLLVASCSSDPGDEPRMQKTEMEPAAPLTAIRSLDEAIQIANDARGLLGNGSTVSRAVSERELDLTDGVSYVTMGGGVSRSGSEADTLLYVLNYKDNAGYAVVSARRSGEALLAVTESGHYTTAEECQNPGVAMFMDMAVQYSAGLPINPPGGGGGFEIQECKTVETILEADTVYPRVKVEWGRGEIYGQLCPNLDAGYGNVAMAQAMSYFEYPLWLELTYHPLMAQIRLDWPELKQHVGKGNTSCCQSTAAHETLGYLMRELGYRTNSDYNFSMTYTSLSSVSSALSGFGYSVGLVNSYTSKCVRSKLGDGLMIMSGSSSTTGNSSYIWVVDGYRYQKKEVVDYVRPISSTVWTETQRVVTESLNNHINWGLDGVDNGFFNDGVFSSASISAGYNVKYFTVRP